VVQDAGHIATDEMRRVFNLGVGLVAVCAPDDVAAVRAAASAAGVETWIIGATAPGSGAVRFDT